MSAAVTGKPSAWKDGIYPIGAISGRQLGYNVPPRAGRHVTPAGRHAPHRSEPGGLTAVELTTWVVLYVLLFVLLTTGP